MFFVTHVVVNQATVVMSANATAYKRDQRRKELEEKRKRVAEARAKRQANTEGGVDDEEGSEGVAAVTSAPAAKATGLFDQLSASDNLDALLSTIETQVPTTAAASSLAGPSKKIELTLAPSLFKFSVEPRETLMYPRRIQVDLLPDAHSTSATTASGGRSGHQTRTDTAEGGAAAATAAAAAAAAGGLTASGGEAGSAATTGVTGGAGEGKGKEVAVSINVDKILESAEFLEFLADASVPVERALALNAKYDVLTDYAKGRANDGEKALGNNLNLQTSLADDRWTKFRSVTSLCLSSEFRDLVAVSYSASESASSNDADGLVLLWSLHNLLGRPEYVLTCQSPVLSTALNPFDSNMVIGGTYSGQIVIWDLRQKNGQPVRRTSLAALDGHSHPVFCLRIVGSQNAHSLLSISTDGRLCVWRVDDLNQPAEMMEILSSAAGTGSSDPSSLTAGTSASASASSVAAGALLLPSGDGSASSAAAGSLPSSASASASGSSAAAGESGLLQPASGSVGSLVRESTTTTLGSSSTHPVAVTCMAFSESETNSFLVGSEEGVAYRIVRHAKTKGIETLYSGHFGPITAVDIHPSRGAVDFSGLFITASIDWTVKIWSQTFSSAHQQQSRPVPLRSFEDSTDYVSDVKWSPVHPAVFASADGSGVLRLWNLNLDTDAPVAKLAVTDGRSINHIAWTLDGRKLVVGDTTGTVSLIDAGDLAVPSPNEYTTLQSTLQRLEDASLAARPVEL